VHDRQRLRRVRRATCLGCLLAALFWVSLIALAVKYHGGDGAISWP
jgi:hypothetical protein